MSDSCLIKPLNISQTYIRNNCVCYFCGSNEHLLCNFKQGISNSNKNNNNNNNSSFNSSNSSNSSNLNSDNNTDNNTDNFNNNSNNCSNCKFLINEIPNKYGYYKVINDLDYFESGEVIEDDISLIDEKLYYKTNFCPKCSKPHLVEECKVKLKFLNLFDSQRQSFSSVVKSNDKVFKKEESNQDIDIYQDELLQSIGPSFCKKKREREDELESYDKFGDKIEKRHRGFPTSPNRTNSPNYNSNNQRFVRDNSNSNSSIGGWEHDGRGSNSKINTSNINAHINIHINNNFNYIDSHFNNLNKNNNLDNYDKNNKNNPMNTNSPNNNFNNNNTGFNNYYRNNNGSNGNSNSYSNGHNNSNGISSLINNSVSKQYQQYPNQTSNNNANQTYSSSQYNRYMTNVNNSTNNLNNSKNKDND